jgi:NADPH2:quinone reductase
MRAAVVTTLAGPAGAEVREVREPSTSSDEVLIDVAFAGVGFPDLLQTRGEYQQRPDLPFIPGFEVAGIVRADVGRFRAGDRVAAMPMLGVPASGACFVGQGCSTTAELPDRALRVDAPGSAD